ncbi:MAG: cyclase family protein, partial [Actinomycetota bacterium]
RFAENFTFQIATQVDGLNHVGTGQWYYNNNRLDDMITPTGTTVLGNETMGPIATRGVIIDIVGLKVAAGQTDDFFIAGNGQPVLRDNYRITIDDIENALYRQRINRSIGAGDIPILHTGWTHLVREDPGRYLAQEPGIFLAEARYFADKKVAMIAGDAWGLEVTDPDVTGGNAFPCHQELFGKYGIRIGESFVTDAAIADHVYEGFLVITPENVPGATCGSSAPTLLGGRSRRPRS